MTEMMASLTIFPVRPDQPRPTSRISARIPAFLSLCLIIGLLAFIQPGDSARAEHPREVTVRLFEAHQPIHELRALGPFEIMKPLRQTIRQAPIRLMPGRPGEWRLLRMDGRMLASGLGPLILKPVSAQGVLRVQADRLHPRSYPGLLIVSRSRQGLELLNRLPARTYVAVVTGSETMPGWPAEALKAQAVLTQTRLARLPQRLHLGDSTGQEVYLGTDHLRPDVLKAVHSVWGETLLYAGRPITPYYHASCGGRTSDGRFLSETIKQPWLSGVNCPYCRGVPFSKPTRTVIPEADFLKAFGGRPAVIRQDEAGRPLTVQLGAQTTWSGYAFWLRLGQWFGWDKTPGTRFAFEKLPDHRIQITSTGAGHGVGLCQWGSAGMARQGKSYREILRFYFPETRLSKP